MTKWLTLTDVDTHTPCYVRVDHILAIYYRPGGSVLELTSSASMRVKQRPEEVYAQCVAS